MTILCATLQSLGKQMQDVPSLVNECRKALRLKVSQDRKTTGVWKSDSQDVKSIPPTTENWLRKHYKYSKKNYKSTEDKHETNHINNKCNDMNMNTRKMHNIWAWTQARTLSHFDVGVTCTSWLQFWVPSYHPCTCASLLEFTSLTLYFDLSFTVLFHFSFLMHFEQHTELDNLIAMQKPAHLREQGESRRLRRLRLLLRLWAQLHGLQRAQRPLQVPSPTLPRHRTRT